MIRYDRLWTTMEAKSITQYRLIKQYNFSAGQIGRLKKNMHVSTHTLDTLCSILGCDISDIIEYVPGASSPDAMDANQNTASIPEDTLLQAAQDDALLRDNHPAQEDDLPKASNSGKKAALLSDSLVSAPPTGHEGKSASSPVSSSSTPKKADSPKGDKQKKAGKSKKGDKKAAKEGKKSKDGKKSK